MNVPFLDLKRAYEVLAEELEEAVLGSLRSGRYIGGTEVEAFEEAFAAFCGARHCVAVANGLEALHLSLRALGIGAGDEVIVPSNTFIATWLAVSQAGARCIPVEPDAATSNLDPTLIEAAVTPATRAIIPVHLYGQPADLDPILSIAERHGLAVLEDAAQAQGAVYKGRRIGSHGALVAWSFYPGKNLGALGDAGSVTTDDADLAARLRLLRNYGSQERYHHEIQGYNSRLDPVQAAALRVKLRHLDRWNGRRIEIARRYQAAFRDIGLATPHVLNGAEPVWHLYCVRHSRRDDLRRLLHEAGIETLIHYPVPPHLQGAYAGMGFPRGSFPIAERLADELLSLPIDPLMRDDAVETVIAAVRNSVHALARAHG
jgi:dTDP-4-amino-4,6-dideoxygalactose transaminase